VEASGARESLPFAVTVDLLVTVGGVTFRGEAVLARDGGKLVMQEEGRPLAILGGGLTGLPTMLPGDERDGLRAAILAEAMECAQRAGLG